MGQLRAEKGGQFGADSPDKPGTENDSADTSGGVCSESSVSSVYV